MNQPLTRYELLLDKLRRRGHRITPQRAAILKIFSESRDHPTIEQVHAQVLGQFPMTSLATVYKTVTMLKVEDEILELPFANQGSRYDGSNPTPHPHLVCLKCQRIIDADSDAFIGLPGELAQKYGYQIISQRVDFFGICPRCRQLEQVNHLTDEGASAPVARSTKS